MKLILLIFLTFSSFLYAKEYTINLKGEQVKENITIKVELKTDDEGKPLAQQKYDIRNLENINSLKIITASGLLGTLKDEREIIAYYKTNLNVGGLKIRNLYKAAVTRIYGEEDNITMSFDPDHYQNIISFLRYHNVKQDLIKDIDNMYGTWEEIDK
ncbi:MAG: hypothetical protein U9Q33_03025 [Campylobacterota bacterium]|nr:hypothetical protein [Campylobacterota bacterium]